MGSWFMCAFKWTFYYFIYKIKSNIGITVHRLFKLASLFTLLLLWCSAVENSLGLHFSVYTSIMLSIGQTLVKDYYWWSECIWKRLGRWSDSYKCSAWPRNVGPVHENLFAYSLFRLRISTCPINFICVNVVF